MLPHNTGHSALPRLHSLMRSGGIFIFVGALILQVSPATADGSGWQSTNWTGVIAGAPEPGVGLPAVPSPAGAPVALPAEYDVPAEYEGQSTCDPVPKPGTQRFADLIKATYGQDEVVWIPRDCGVNGQSEHKEGRALDWMRSVRDPQGRAEAEAFLNWLLGPDQFGVAYGNAIRLGVMYIGWNDRIWRGYKLNKGWTELKGCFSTPDRGSDNTCHRNHIHISLTWDGASGRSSFWDGTALTAPYCVRSRSTASGAPATRVGGVVAVDAVRVVGTRSGIGVTERCRLQQGRWNGDSHRIYAKVTGVGGVPAEGVAAVHVRVSALGTNAATTLRAWSPGASSSVPVVIVPMNADASGDAIIPVASNGTIAIANTAGATDVIIDVLGYYPSGPEVENRSEVVSETLVLPMTELGPNPAAVPVASEAPAVPAPGAPPEEDFIGIGAELGYESISHGAIQPGEIRTVTLNGLPAQATSALVTVTTSGSTKKGKLRIGQIGQKVNAATVRLRKAKTRTAILVVPVVGGTVQISASKKPAVQVKVEVLGYRTGALPLKARGMSARKLIKTKFNGTKVKLAKVTGIGDVPKKKNKVLAVILRVTTKGKGADGRFAAYAVGGVDRGSRSATVTAKGKRTSIVVADVGDKGLIALASNVRTKVWIKVVGYIRR